MWKKFDGKSKGDKSLLIEENGMTFDLIEKKEIVDEILKKFNPHSQIWTEDLQVSRKCVHYSLPLW